MDNRDDMNDERKGKTPDIGDAMPEMPTRPQQMFDAFPPPDSSQYIDVSQVTSYAPEHSPENGVVVQFTRHEFGESLMIILMSGAFFLVGVGLLINGLFFGGGADYVKAGLFFSVFAGGIEFLVLKSTIKPYEKIETEPGVAGVRRCMRCGRLFDSDGRDICRVCQE